MLENWISDHPWMIFILGIMSLATLNTFFVSIGGGYRKFPPVLIRKEDDEDKEEKQLLHD